MSFKLHKKKQINAIAYLSVLAVASSAVSIKPLEVKAKENTTFTSNESLQPTGNAYSIDTLLNWTAESDLNARYNRGTIKLKDRFKGNKVNPNANPNARIMNCALTNPKTDNAPSQGGDTENAYSFSYWQYVDCYVYWGGSNRGIFVPPTADVIDCGHKNGVPVLGTVGFPWGPGEGHVEQVQKFLKKDSNGNFPVADKMIEIANFYGFDGWFINQESYGCGKKEGDLMVEFFTYIHKKDPNIKIGWYDSMTTDGPVRYQDSLNDTNVGFFQSGENKVIDQFFLNYNWNPEKINKSVETANKVGRNPYDVYAGLDVQQNAYNTDFRVKDLLDENGKLKVSLAMYCPNSTFSMSKNIEDFYMQDQKFWVGPSGDPSKSNTDEKWVGLSNYVSDSSPINDMPFVTNFNLGHGSKYYIDGSLKREKPWNNRALQDYLPTWRWIVESNGSKLKPDFDRSDAFNGGSSLKIQGNLESKNPNHIKLYSTDLNIENPSTELSITYKTPLNKTNMEIGLCFGDNYDQSNFKFFPIENGIPNTWNTKTISLKDYIGKKISAISLRFKSDKDINNFKINIGNISIEEKDKNTTLPKTNKITLDDVLYHSSQRAEAKIYWDKVPSCDFYEIYRVTSDGSKEFVGATYNNSYYISQFKRHKGENQFDFQVVPLDKNYNRGESQSITFRWNMPEGSTEEPEEKERINLALNKPVKASSENSGEPAIKAVDGTVENNSKWCTTENIRGAWLEVDLGESKTVERWVTMHGEAGGEAKDTNSSAFRLQVLKDDGKTYEDVDVVTNNTKGVVDRNLKEPVKGRFFRLYIDDPGPSPWAAVRIYEFQLYGETYTPTTNNVPMDTVKAINNKGSKDEVIFKEVPKGYDVLLYKNINDNKPFISKKSQNNGPLKFEDLNFGEKEGRIYFAMKEEGKNPSVKSSVFYDNENWEVPEIPNNFKITNYKILKDDNNSLNNKYYGTLKIGDLKPFDVVKYYENKNDDFPKKVSVQVGEKETSTVLSPLEFNKDGGEITLEIVREGMKSTPKFTLAYTKDKVTSTKGTLEIKVTAVNKVKNNKSLEEPKKEEIKEEIKKENLSSKASMENSNTLNKENSIEDNKDINKTSIDKEKISKDSMEKIILDKVTLKENENLEGKKEDLENNNSKEKKESLIKDNKENIKDSSKEVKILNENKINKEEKTDLKKEEPKKDLKENKVTTETIPISGAKYEIIKDGKIIKTIITDEAGNGKTQLDPGKYILRYTGNLKDYGMNPNEKEILIEKPFENKIEELTLVKGANNPSSNKPNNDNNNSNNSSNNTNPTDNSNPSNENSNNSNNSNSNNENLNNSEINKPNKNENNINNSSTKTNDFKDTKIDSKENENKIKASNLPKTGALGGLYALGTIISLSGILLLKKKNKEN